MQFVENFIAGKCAESVGMRIKMFLKKRPVCDIINRLWRVVRVVDRAALEIHSETVSFVLQESLIYRALCSVRKLNKCCSFRQFFPKRKLPFLAPKLLRIDIYGDVSKWS